MIYQVSTSNQITKSYYYTVKHMENAGVTKLKAVRAKLFGYITYHLVTVR